MRTFPVCRSSVTRKGMSSSGNYFDKRRGHNYEKSSLKEVYSGSNVHSKGKHNHPQKALNSVYETSCDPAALDT